VKKERAIQPKGGRTVCQKKGVHTPGLRWAKAINSLFPLLSLKGKIQKFQTQLKYRLPKVDPAWPQ